MGVVDSTSAAAARDAILIRAWRGARQPMQESADKVGALLDAVRVLDAMSVGHALIGGVAVGVHSGVPRATLDVDLAISAGADRGSVIQRFVQAGFRLTGEFAHSVNFRHASGEPVQLACDAEFDPMIARAERFDVGGVSVPIVRKDDLIAMKERAAADVARRPSKRLRDQADVALLRGDVPDPDEGW
jgi:hypothetical protein